MSNRTPLDFESIRQAATGRWLDLIYPALGIDIHPNQQHQPCPLCGGKDRFRCDNQNGTGSWICNQCGAGQGYRLAQEYTKLDHYEMHATIASILGIDGKVIITQAQKDAWKAEQDHKAAQANQAKEQAYTATANKALHLWQQATQANPNHPYLQRKQIVGTYLKQQNDELLAPLYHLDNISGQVSLVNIQRIKPDGSKLFLQGGRQKDCFFFIGQPSAVILVAEGVATAGSLYEATQGQYLIVCAYNAGNLMGVGVMVRQLFPDAFIIFCADNDALTALNIPKNGNVGINKACQAAQAVNGLVIHP